MMMSVRVLGERGTQAIDVSVDERVGVVVE
jgi:hypothetical protein